MLRIIVTCVAGLLALAIGSSYLGGLIGVVERALIGGDAISSGALGTAAAGLCMAAVLLGVGSLLLGGSLGRGVRWLAGSALLLALAAWSVGYLGAAGPWVLLAIAIGAVLTALTSRRGGRGGRAGLVVAVVALVAIGCVGWLLGGEGDSFARSTGLNAPAVALDDGVIDLDAPTVKSPVARIITSIASGSTGTGGPGHLVGRWALWGLGGGIGALCVFFLLMRGIRRLPLGGTITRAIARFFESFAETDRSFWLWMADVVEPVRVMSKVIISSSGAYGRDRLLRAEEIIANWGQGDGFVLGELRARAWWRSLFKLDRAALLAYSGNGSILIEAAPEKGKTSGNVIPTLLTPSSESRVVLDVKGELVWVTAGYRRSLGQRVLVMDPQRITEAGRAGQDARINVLTASIPASGEAIADRAMQLITLLLPPSSGGDNNEYFKDNARSLLLGLLVWVRCAPADLLGEVPRSLIGVKGLLDLSEGITAYIRDVVVPNSGRLPRHAQPIVSALGKFLALAEETFSSAATQAGNSLAFLMSFGWRRALGGELDDDGGAGEVFKFSDFFEAGTDLYLAITPAQLKANPTAPRLFFGCLFNELIEEGVRRGGKGLDSKVRFVLDEAAQMGRIDSLVTAVEVGRTVARIMFVVQYYGQLIKAYGKEDAETLRTSFACKLYLSVSSGDAAKRISQESGMTTVLDRSTSNRDGNSLRERGREVLTVGDITTMPSSRAIVMGPSPRRGEPSYAAEIDRIFWETHPRFGALGNKAEMPPSPPVDGEVEEPTEPVEALAEAAE